MRSVAILGQDLVNPCPTKFFARSMGSSLSCPLRRKQSTRALVNWHRIVQRLLNLRWLQRVFWAVGTTLQKFGPELRKRLSKVDPPIRD